MDRRNARVRFSIDFRRMFQICSLFCSSDEIMFVFGEPFNITDSKMYTEEEIELSERIMGYWTNFAKYGYKKMFPRAFRRFSI